MAWLRAQLHPKNLEVEVIYVEYVDHIAGVMKHIGRATARLGRGGQERGITGRCNRGRCFKKKKAAIDDGSEKELADVRQNAPAPTAEHRPFSVPRRGLRLGAIAQRWLSPHACLLLRGKRCGPNGSC